MLIIVESPAKAKTIAKIVSNQHVVKASVGHVRQLSDKNTAPDGRKLEISGVDIDNNFQPIFEVVSGKQKVIAEIRTLGKKFNNQILFATDSDREGEAISWHLSEILGISDKTQVKRLEFHEITPKAIWQAINNPRPLNLKLVEAQQARQVLDKLVGYKLSPVLWTVMGNYKLSAGRVQSPALCLICEREKEIANFVSQEYWEIKGRFQTTAVTQVNFHWLKEGSRDWPTDTEQVWFKPTKIGGQILAAKPNSQTEVESWLKGIEQYPEYRVVSVTEKTKIIATKPPFITSTLQQAASSKLGFSPKLTMQLAQDLYEGMEIDGSPVALITYMRTDSTNLASDFIEQSRQLIKQQYPEYLPAKPKIYPTKSRNAQEAHEAIRPTDPWLTPASLRGKLPPRHWKLYDLIWKQTIASQMTEEVRQEVNVVLVNTRQDEFVGTLSWTIHPGFKSIWEENVQPADTPALPKMGEVMYLSDLFCVQKFTQPPVRYSPASLIKKMEELGIGRPSTYATIISTLYDRGYVENNPKTLIPTSLGMRINDLLVENFPLVTSSQMTAKMEADLDEISQGRLDYTHFLHNFWWDFKQLVDTKAQELKQNRQKYQVLETDVVCPKYGDRLVLKTGRYGEYYQNPNHPECIYPKNFREYAAALQQAEAEFGGIIQGLVCQECGKPLAVRVSQSTLKPYVACPDYKVGNKHTVVSLQELLQTTGSVAQSRPESAKSKSNSRKIKAKTSATSRKKV